MSVKTKSVPSRRTLRFESFDEMLQEIDRLRSGEVERLGNWTLAQVVEHLAAAVNGCIDGGDFRAPWLLRKFAKWFLRDRFLNVAVPAGFQIPTSAAKQFVPDESADLDSAIDSLRLALDRLGKETKRFPHSVIEELTVEEWNRFHLRHAELHLGFLRPVAADTD